MSDYTPPKFCPVCLDPTSLCRCAPITPVNQCDGCRAGLTLDRGMHRDKGGRAVMVCQRTRYIDILPR